MAKKETKAVETVKQVEGTQVPEVVEKQFEAHDVKVKVLLNVRSEATLESKVVEVLQAGTVKHVTEEQNGFGKIENGWIMLGFTARVENA